jgi:hypothetical protein
LPDFSHQGAIFLEPEMDNFPRVNVESPSLARYKLDRLRELRAVIDSMHRERESKDPFLNWIAERKISENH